MLKATACETMPHCGMTLARVLNSFFAIERSAIARNYTVRDVFCRSRFLLLPYSAAVTHAFVPIRPICS